jgi:hypothetical protein
MDKVPFSVYDFLGYLAAGFLLSAGVGASFVGADELNENPSLIVSILLIVIAYIAGHVVANVAGFVLEKKLVADVLGRPTQNLFGASPRRYERLFPGYYGELPSETRTRVLEKARSLAGISEPGEGLFFHCHARVKKEQAVMERLNTFLNLYGFCRNACMALVIVAACLLVGVVIGSAETGGIGAGWCAAAALAGAIGTFYRYLKFFRQYAIELYTSYAELD